jgi:nucleoside-diphosphate-sugar epimerase
MQTKLNYVITGATGLLGRNLLFEILKNHLDNLSDINIFILGRSNKQQNLKQRIMQIIENDGIHYLALQSPQYSELESVFNDVIQCVHYELGNIMTSLSESDKKLLKGKPIDYFYHLASETDFRNTPDVRNKLQMINVDGTKSILDLVDILSVKSFIYVGSAYSCGETFGNIAPDYINFNQNFRNPYEKSKLEAEVLVRKHAEKHRSIEYKFFRPSTICGRLIENKIGAVSKFDVFYAFMFFFLRCKEQMFKVSELQQNAQMRCRVVYSLNSGLNIVPVDYAAKTMFILSHSNLSEQSFHLVNNQETLNQILIPAMAKAINMEGMVQVEMKPNDTINSLEAMYYRTVGSIYTPYTTSKPMLFIQPKYSDLIGCPAVDEKNFNKLLDYALLNRN